MQSYSGDEATAVVGGDGADTPADLPKLEVAWFDGSPSPQEGDRLYLQFNEEMAVDPAALFDNEDVTFWTPVNSIGTSSPILLCLHDPFTVEVTLGQAPQFTVNGSATTPPWRSR